MKFYKVIIFVIAVCAIQACKKNTAEFSSDPALFREYIASYTSGIVAANSDIRVVLAFKKSDLKVNQKLDSDLFDISPNVRGKVVALSANTISFIPDQKLKNGTQYQVKFNLSKLIKVSDEVKEFRFTVNTDLMKRFFAKKRD